MGIAIFGGFGGVCMPFMTLAQNLLLGAASPEQLTQGRFWGWIAGMLIYFIIGGGVAYAIEQSNSGHAKALVIGLTLPATITALGHGAQLGAAASASAWSLISPAHAQQQQKQGQWQVLTIGPADLTDLKVHGCSNDDCELIFFNDKEGPVRVKIFTSEPSSNVQITKDVNYTIPPATNSVSVVTPAGTTPSVHIPPASDRLALKVEPRSQFALGLRTALGLSTTPYTIQLQSVQ